MGRRKSKKNKKKIVRGVKIINNDIMAGSANIKSTGFAESKTNGSAVENGKPANEEFYDVSKKVENNKDGSTDSNNKVLKRYCLYSGVIGALIALGFVVLFAYSVPGFRYSSYYVNKDPSLLTQLLSTNLSEQDSLYVVNVIEEETGRRRDLIEDMLEEGIIVSSEDFASNLSGYYNVLIAVLASLLVILNLFGFFAWRSNAEGTLEQEKRKLSDIINEIDYRMEKNIEEVLRKNSVVREKLEAYIQGVVDQENHLSEDEWNKIHLLLDKYKKKEFLMEIKADEKDNDGSIEEV